MSTGSTRRTFIKLLAVPLLGSVNINARAETGPLPEEDRIYKAPEIVGRVTGKSAEVNIVTPTQGEFLLVYGENPDNLTNKVNFEGIGSLTVEIKDLKPGQKYYYKVGEKLTKGADYSLGEAHNFITQRPPGSPFRFAVFADAHLIGDAKDEHHYDNLLRAAEMALADDIDFVVFVGDEACLDGSGGQPWTPRVAKSQNEANRRYAHFRKCYALLLANRPAFLAQGNHDGEAGFYVDELRKHTVYLQRWGTIARKSYVLNPRPDTYPEGGEDEGWSGPDDDPALGGAEEGNCSPLENYFAWSWGDALFVVLDPFRYTIMRGETPESWTLGKRQMEWLEETLSHSQCRHKFVVAHHLVGGAPWNPDTSKAGAYGRGGAEYSRVGEQEAIHQLMREHGARFFLYGHDHIFRVSARDDIQYVCCGRHSSVSDKWWGNPGWREIYDDDYMALVGYTLVEVNEDSIDLSYKVSGTSTWKRMKWEGRSYSLEDGGIINVESPVIGVVRVWSPDDPKKRDLFRCGGTFRGNTITLRLRPPDGGKKVNVLYMGQKPYEKKFGDKGGG